MYLPSANGYRSCYYWYMRDQGWKAKADAVGKVEVKPVEGEEQKPHISLTTYFYFWKRKYSHLKVSKPVKDICHLCFQFSNQSKFLAKHKTDGVAQNSDKIGTYFLTAISKMTIPAMTKTTLTATPNKQRRESPQQSPRRSSRLSSVATGTPIIPQ